MKRMIITLLTCCIFALSLFATEKEFKKEITKEFSAGANPSLQIENKYGNIRVVESTDNKITLMIEIIGRGKTEALAKQYAESVSIDFFQNGDKISAKTNLKSLNCNNCGRTTHYTILAPKNVIMNLDNKYGNITIDHLIKPLQVDLKYGNIEANTLANVNIDIKYGNIAINTCEDIKIDCGYTKIKIGQANRMTTESKYDDFQIGTVAELNMDTKYTKVKINKLGRSFVCNDFKYCSLDINEISQQFTRIKISAGYSNIFLPLNNSYSFKANLSARYGKIIADNMTFNNVSIRSKERNTEAIIGTIGNNSNPSATVDIATSYGNITFK